MGFLLPWPACLLATCSTPCLGVCPFAGNSIALKLKEVRHFPGSAEIADDSLGYRGTQAIFLLVFSRSGETLADAATLVPPRSAQANEICSLCSASGGEFKKPFAR
jgi:hypothetical protein